jgi:RNA polymerase sigma factor (sigma-70 family)
VEASAEGLLRELAPRALGAVCRRWRDFAAAEDAVQEALIAATEQWPRDGIPEHPLGWLIHVALRRLTDQIRSDSARRNREASVAAELPATIEASPATAASAAGDDTLLLLFMCCHPTLSQSSAIALTLRAVGGLTTGEIARAFLVPLPTMAQRISRAKELIRHRAFPSASRMPRSAPPASRRFFTCST